jgi:hypothetical protein
VLPPELIDAIATRLTNAMIAGFQLTFMIILPT